MDVQGIRMSTGAAGAGGPERRPETKKEAARRFEEVLVRQFVRTMTDDLFKGSLAGEQGPGWVGAYQDTQRDVLTDVLTQHLVDSGALRISDLLLRQWERLERRQEGEAATDDRETISGPLPVGERPLSLEKREGNDA